MDILESDPVRGTESWEESLPESLPIERGLHQCRCCLWGPSGSRRSW